MFGTLTRFFALICFSLCIGNRAVAQNKTVNGRTNIEQPAYLGAMDHFASRDMKESGYTVYYDYASALLASGKFNKPVLVYFTGVNCVNCRKMEKVVLAAHGVFSRLSNDFIIAALYCDMTRIILPENEQFYSDVLKKQVLTLADKNQHLQAATYKSNSQPTFYIIDAGEHLIINEPYTYDLDVQKFIDLLDNARNIFHKP